MRAQVALVATEDRAGVTFEDGVLGVVGPPEKADQTHGTILAGRRI